MRFRKMHKIIYVIMIFSLAAVSSAEAQILKKAKDYRRIEAKVVKAIPLPKLWHEGLFQNGGDIWVCNGKGGKVWVVNAESGAITSEIMPVAGFTEAIAKGPDDTYFVTDWDAKKLYKVKIENSKMIAQSELSLALAHPAGLALVGSRIFVVTWTRGLGTKFNLLEIDEEMQILQNIRIDYIQEPAHIAWDGKNLWMTSWFYRRVYKIDLAEIQITAELTSPIDKTTGIMWDGKHLWLTGTHNGLYQLELSE
ncbi:MAG: hypothetical protein WC738_03260 [Candidatus Omnitrophota bacterium]|jgi:glutamine cyclotransferase